MLQQAVNEGKVYEALLAGLSANLIGFNHPDLLAMKYNMPGESHPFAFSFNSMAAV